MSYQSCDVCRKRKVKCIKNNPMDRTTPCKHCHDLEIPCTYEYRPKRRGPVNQYVSRLREGKLEDLGQPSNPQKNEGSSSSLTSSPTLGGSTTQNSTIPSISTNMSDPSTHQLDVLASRDVLLQIISSFFDFVYPNIPCIHRPSFMTDLEARREESDPVFFALVASLIATTLAQTPGPCLPLEGDEVRLLAKRCYEASRSIMAFSYDPPTTMHIVLRYCDAAYIYRLGNDSAATRHAAFGEAVQVGYTLRFQKEEYYKDLDVIDGQMRRRIFWVLYGADQSSAIENSWPINLRLEDCTVDFPAAVDDEYITPHGILPQPPHQTPIVAGLIYLSRMFALQGELLARIRIDERSPPEGRFAVARLEEVGSIHEKIMNVMSTAPESLRLRDERHSPTLTRFANIGDSAYQQLDEYFADPDLMRMNSSSNAFDIKKADLLVTQQRVRFVVEEYHDRLRLAIEGRLDPVLQKQKRELVMEDLLQILHGVPIQAIAANGPAICHKVRYIASALLPELDSQSEYPTKTQQYLWDFLNVLSEIEKQFSVIYQF
ncbi:hypothetical protein K435DRAFT_768268 [Dendrothele bispora CBS 962.96]|uniref:Zn(2)-C6 fungal-type domain-containing protein n=1 Tax=Dendrothele bispora (strain CBS 962.96) TaxID=1314807 RepID=A0A4S8KWC6_DENBC|nr:hypothetical protein K435DRAFT_768268 [Dendrothele bispora CBS 962.96]